jgi:NTE family protein
MKIGLALSGGGALGAAHIGVISELEKRRVSFSSICGASAGAIVGLLYSWGGLGSINEFFSLIDERNIFGPKNIILARSPDRLFMQIEDVLRDIVHTDDFDGLRIKFSCAATDFSTGDTEEFVSGDPIQCVMASAAYPGVFPMREVSERFFIDGGVTLNMPVSPLKRQDMDFIIASSIYSISIIDPHKTRIKKLQTAIRALEIMQHRMSEYELSQADFVFTPPVEEHYWYNFSMMKRIRAIGEEYAAGRIRDLPAL